MAGRLGRGLGLWPGAARVGLWGGLLAACGPAEPKLSPGEWGLRANDSSKALFSYGPTPGGTITVNPGGCGGAEVRVALWTGGLVTPGGRAVVAEVQGAADGSEVWLTVPVETGPGEGKASIWWSPEAGLAKLPLGGRPGEFELTFDVVDEALPDVGAAAQEAVAAEADAWSEGRFVLEDGNGRSVGAIRMFGAEEPPRVGVWDALWLTDGMVPALRADDGGDLILQFRVEPRVQSEDAMVRFNVATRRVVVPAAPHPNDLDRWLLARPGVQTEREIDDAIDSAIERADAAERAWVAEMGAKLARAAATSSGCLEPAEVDGGWELLLKGYTVSVHAEGEDARGASAHVAVHERLRRRIGQAGVVDPPDLRMRPEMAGDL